MAKVTDAGLLQVGPESMGAFPGPACYQRGGVMPTVTDADVILGFIEPKHFLGGTMKISRELSLAAMRTHVGAKMGLDEIEAAAAVHEIVNAHMADLIRRASVERGHDPRQFTLVAFGGCGPVHGAALGAEIGTEAVIVPPAATAFSAMGISQSDIRHTFVRSFPHTLRMQDGKINEDVLEDLNAAFAEFSLKAREYLNGLKLIQNDAEVRYAAEIRYRSQAQGILVPLQFRPPADAATLTDALQAFEQLYERAYGAGSSSARTRVEWVGLRADVIAPTPHSPRAESSAAPARLKVSNSAKLGMHQMYSLARKRLEPVPVYHSESLIPGNCIDGQALIVSYGFTIPIHEGQTGHVDQFGNLVIN